MDSTKSAWSSARSKLSGSLHQYFVQINRSKVEQGGVDGRIIDVHNNWYTSSEYNTVGQVNSLPLGGP